MSWLRRLGFSAQADRRGAVVIGGNEGILITGTVKGNVVLQDRPLPVAELSLPFRAPRPNVPSLLSWKSRLTDLIGRETELADLQAWAAQAMPKLSLRLLYGSGGTGKSRLAAHLAERLREQGWAAGRVDLTVHRPTAFRMGAQGTLLLLDYPEEHQKAVYQVLAALDRIEEDALAVPVRVLLVSRQDQAFWKEVIERAHVAALFERPLALRPLTQSDPYVLFTQGWHAACKILGQLHADVPLDTAGFAAWSSGHPLHIRPLFILAYAIQQAMLPEVGDLRGPDIIDALAGRERQRLHDLAEQAELGSDALVRLTALAALRGGLDTKVIRALAAQPALELGLGTPEKLMDQLQRTGLLEAARLPAVEPDILAAALLADVLEASADRAGEWLWVTLPEDQDAVSAACQRLGRLIYDAEQVLDKTWPISALVQAVMGQTERCERLDGPLRQDYLPRGLLPIAIAVGQTLVETYRDDHQRHAEQLNNLSVRLAEGGDQPGALQAGQQAVELYKHLAEQAPAAFEPDLAQSLNNLSNRLADAGDRPGALQAIQRAVELRERLAAQAPAAFEPDLAQSLNNLSACLADAGDRPGALQAGQRAVELYERLAAQAPATFEPALAMSLNNLSACLADAGDRPGALQAIQRAVELCERLAAQAPAAFEPALALSLNNLSSCLADAGDRPGALQAIQRAVERYERLAAQAPAAFEPALALSLHNLSACLANTGDWPGALQAIQRAVELRERLAAQAPAAFEPDLAQSLHNLSLRLAETGDRPGALEAVDKAIDLITPYADALPNGLHAQWLSAMRETRTWIQNLSNNPSD